MADGRSKISKRQRSNRTTISCDRCKSRKTKCNKPTAGSPCDYCRSIDEECSFDAAKRRQKPYYFVSEEEYRLLHLVCQKCLPDEELTVTNLRRLASQSTQAASQTIASTPIAQDDITDDYEGARASVGASEEREDVPLPEIVNLHKDLGCLLSDAQGEHRYVGAESGMSFNTAVKSWVLNTTSHARNKDMIPSMVKVGMPIARFQVKPGTPQLDPSKPPEEGIFLACSSRYFEEVHCLYWLYSSEDFHTRLEATYSDAYMQQPVSWLCSMHSIVALGALCVPLVDGLPDKELAHRSLEVAKLLVPKLCDEATLDSVRALVLLALALQSNGYTNSAYLHIGIAIRIAFSLGLHLDKYSAKHGALPKVHARRLWWTLFLVDQDLSLQLGKPCMSGSSTYCPWQPAFPSEEILSPGPYTPQEYLRQYVGLAQLTKGIRHKLYTGPIQDGQKLTLSYFEEAMESLKKWLDNVPPHLYNTATVPPLHRRPIAILHLRYWNAMMLITRPFLLCSLLKGKELDQTPKQPHFDRLARICVSSAEASLEVFEGMARGVLSSLVLVDFLFALQLLQVFLIAASLYRSAKHQNHARRCISVLREIGAFAYAKHLLPEILFQAQKSGLLDDDLGGGQLSSEPFLSFDPVVEGSGESNLRIAEPRDEFATQLDLLSEFYVYDGDDDFMQQLMDISVKLPTNLDAPGTFPDMSN